MRWLLSTAQRRNLAASVQILAGLRFDENLIEQLFREDIVKESVIYQKILQQGVQQGQQLGRQEGEAALIIRQLNRRLGSVDSTTQEQIRNLSSAKLEQWGEALLDFSDATDLAGWLLGQES